MSETINYYGKIIEQIKEDRESGNMGDNRSFK